MTFIKCNRNYFKMENKFFTICVTKLTQKTDAYLLDDYDNDNNNYNNYL